MKNVMKKAVALLVVMAMLCAPVVTNAAIGETIPMPETCIWSGDTVTVGAGETAYFEIGTDATPGTYAFEVVGNAAFTVAICTAGSYDDATSSYTYKTGKPITAVNGKVSTKITSFEYSYGYAAFSITNNMSSAVDFTCTIVYPEGAQSNPFDIALSVGENATVTVPAGAQYWVEVALPAQQVEYVLNITGATGFAFTQGWMQNNDVDGVYTTNIAHYYAAPSFAIINNTQTEQTYTLSIENMPLGSQSNPDAAFSVDSEYETELAGSEYWYIWNAPSNGVLTFTVNTAVTENWTYNIINNTTYEVFNFSTAWDEHSHYTENITVNAGDEILIGISIPTYVEEYDGWDVYTFATGVYAFSTTFVPSEGGDIGGGDDIGGDIGGGEDIGGDDNLDDAVAYGDNYIHRGDYISIGDNTYSVSNTYAYTLFSFAPEETGKYTFTSDNSVMGIISYNGMWVYFDPSAENIAETTLTWECTGVGQEIWIAVLADTNSADITVVKGDLVVNDIEKINYENTAKVEPFTYEGNADELVSVDTFDDVVDTAVLGADGFYHLNSVNGPILYANINDEFMSLVAAQSYGQLKYVIYDEDGNASSIIDYTFSFMDYQDAADQNTFLYPLTADLMAIFQNVGENYGWYGDSGWVGGTDEDAWMFACYYNESDIGDGSFGDDDDDNGNANNGGENNNNNNADNNAPDTGDNMIMIVVAAAVAVVAFATVLVLFIRRRKTTK